jgi:NAD(P)H-flavin reductase/hemoglobin-like flavoprotein
MLPHAQFRDDDPYLLEETLALIERRADKAIAYFYAVLFLDQPQAREMFPVAMDTQRDRFFRALIACVRGLRGPDRAAGVLAQLGRDHRKYGVRPEHYDAVGAALLSALRKYAEEVWVKELEEAWIRCYSYMAASMIAAAQAAETEPAYWDAQIVAHERRALDTAVLILRTDRPYPYRAGQYASVETPYRPRLWRTFSLATAPIDPQGENILELHVKAVDGGWVSGPLVWRAQTGDRLRLGPPMGDMAMDPDSGRDVLAIAGGTGLAPIKAIIEDATNWNRTRRVHLFFGVRRTQDLYDLAALHRLATRHLWLRVVPCVSDDVTYSGEQGVLADVITRYAPLPSAWVDHDVLVCGSPSMVRATVQRLRAQGVPPAQIRYDASGELDPDLAQVVDLRQLRDSMSRS